MLQEVKASKSLSESEGRLVDLYLLEGKLNGVELAEEDKTKFLQTLHQLSEHRSSFRLILHAFHGYLIVWLLCLMCESMVYYN